MNALSGATSWSADSSDFQQYFIIDLGNVMNITRIDTQGRSHTVEYVAEYTVSYGTNGLDYADYKEDDGNTKVSTCFFWQRLACMRALADCNASNLRFIGGSREILHFSACYPTDYLGLSSNNSYFND